MHRMTVAMVAVVGTLGLLPQQATAWDVVLKQKVTKFELYDACRKVGGNWSSRDGVTTCTNPSKGTRVDCTNDGSTCTGSGPGPMPRRGAPSGLVGVLKSPVVVAPADKLAPDAMSGFKGQGVVKPSGKSLERLPLKPRELSPSGPGSPVFKPVFKPHGAGTLPPDRR